MSFVGKYLFLLTLWLHFSFANSLKIWANTNYIGKSISIEHYPQDKGGNLFLKSDKDKALLSFSDYPGLFNSHVKLSVFKTLISETTILVEIRYGGDSELTREVSHLFILENETFKPQTVFPMRINKKQLSGNFLVTNINAEYYFFACDEEVISIPLKVIIQKKNIFIQPDIKNKESINQVYSNYFNSLDAINYYNWGGTNRIKNELDFLFKEYR